MKYNDYRVYAPPRTGHNAVNDWIWTHHDGLLDYTRRLAQTTEWLDKVKSEYITITQHKKMGALVNIESSLFPSELFTYKTDGMHSVNIVTLRDPLNTLASTIKKWWPHTETYTGEVYCTFMFGYMEYAREYLRLTTRLEEPFIPINYNNWFTSEAYRVQLGELLGLRKSCWKQYMGVPLFGKGSSFDGRRYLGRADQMDVLNRYKLYKEHPYMQRLAAHSRMQEISLEIFNMDMQKLTELPNEL